MAFRFEFDRVNKILLIRLEGRFTDESRDLAAQGKKVRVGMEASGHARWFEAACGKLLV